MRIVIIWGWAETVKKDSKEGTFGLTYVLISTPLYENLLNNFGIIVNVNCNRSEYIVYSGADFFRSGLVKKQ